jgi:hypothetical protein
VSKKVGKKELSFTEAFESDAALTLYGEDSLLLFALSLYLGEEDIEELAAEALTGGPNDKKVDACHIDIEEGRAVICQGYLAKTWGKCEAPANKASDLNTAVSWLLSAKLGLVPPALRSKALELRTGLRDGDVRRIDILFVHNCYESKNVAQELKTVADGAKAMLNSDDVVVTYRELGLNSIEELYRSRDREILVEERLEVPASTILKEAGEGWKAVVTSVPGDWIRELYSREGDRLFSANFRGYLGSIRRKGNINFAIQQTIANEPGNFWVFNNGVTCLTNKLSVEGQKLTIQGISIINGAQTSGTMGESEARHAGQTRVLFRVVECSSQNLIPKIIQYNNTQNVLIAVDTISKSPVQNRLCRDLDKYGIPYVHRRAGGRSRRNAISAAKLGPQLCALHGDPQTSGRNAKEIFLDEKLTARVFSSTISAEHVFLVASLSRAIDDLKYDLKLRVANKTATKSQQDQFEILRYSMSKFYLLYLIGTSAEEIMGSRISDLFEWKCLPDVIGPNKKAMDKAWKAALGTLLPQIALVTSRRGQPYDVTRSAKLSKEAADELRATLASLETVLGSQFAPLRKATTV